MTGIVNTMLVLGQWPHEPISPYQRLLDIKIVLVFAMTGLAVLNRYVFVPRLRTRPDRAIASIQTGTLVEVILGIGVLALVAIFGLMDPN